MKLPLQITFLDVPRSEDVEDRVRIKAAKLDKFFDRITGCRVVIASPHRHSHSGNHYNVRIELSVPGEEIVVNRDPAKHKEHEDLSIALRDAFAAAQRQLQSYARRNQAAKSGAYERITDSL